MVQTAVKAAVGESKIAQNVNADEAAVLGAALHGARLSRQFKTKDIRITDISPYDIQVSYQSEAKSENSKTRTINTLVFGSGSKHGSKKTLTFRRKDDFSLKLTYRSPPVAGYPTDLLEAEIKGIPEALKNLTEAGATDPVIKATVMLSESGFASIQDVIAFGEIKDDTIAGKLKGFFGAGSSASSETESESQAEARATSSSSSSAEATATEAAKKEKPKDTVPLQFDIKLSSLPPMTVAEKRAARDR